MYKFCYNCIKPKYEDRAKLCYMDTDNFVIYTQTDYFCKDIADDVEKWFDTFNYDKNDKKPLPIDKKKKIVGLFKDELNENIMKEFVAPRTKTYAYLMQDDSEHKKEKATKKCVIRRELMFENYKNCVLNYKIILKKKKQQAFRSDHHNIYTAEIYKIALSCNDDKRVQTFDKISTYPRGTNAFKVCESEMMKKVM